MSIRHSFLTCRLSIINHHHHHRHHHHHHHHQSSSYFTTTFGFFPENHGAHEEELVFKGGFAQTDVFLADKVKVESFVNSGLFMFGHGMETNEVLQLQRECVQINNGIGGRYPAHRNHVKERHPTVCFTIHHVTGAGALGISNWRSGFLLDLMNICILTIIVMYLIYQSKLFFEFAERI